MMLPSRAVRSFNESVRQKIAMISEAAVMTKPSSRGIPPVRPPRPRTTCRSARSFISTVRGQVIWRWSMSRLLGRNRWLSSIAERSPWAAVMAWKSPVKCRLISAMGITWEYPPARRPAFDPEDRPQARLTQAKDGIPLPKGQGVGEPYSDRGFSFTGWGRADARDQNELPVPALPAVDHVQWHLGLVVPVGLDVRGSEPDFGRDLGDGPQLGGLCDLNIGEHSRSVLVDSDSRRVGPPEVAVGRPAALWAPKSAKGPFRLGFSPEFCKRGGGSGGL